MSLLPSGAIETGGYDINNSLRFRSSASAYLNRTPASAGNRKTWTWSGWVKRGALNGGGSDMCLFNAGTTSPNYDGFRIKNDTISFYQGGAVSVNIESTQVFRDPSAWYHFVLAVDTTQATASNRVKIYVNNSQVTAFGTANYPSLNAEAAINNTLVHNIAAQYANTSSSSFLDGYMAEVNFIDGQALTPSSFGETDAVTGVWKAKKYTGTYGTNGFYLPFTNYTSSVYAGYSTNMSTNYNTLPTSGIGTNFQFTGNFTIEGWVLYPTASVDSSMYVIGDGSTYLALNIDMSTGVYNIYCNSGTPSGSFTSNIPLNNWTHVAMVRNGSTITLYTNGVAKGTITSAGTLGYTSPTLNRFGGASTASRYLSNVRITKSAVYTSNFVPPTSALTNIANTVVLTYQNSSAIDNSSNAYAIGTTGAMTYPSGNLIFNANVISDASGNANNWTPNNINYSFYGTTYDAMTDSPTLTSATVANYAVLNPLIYNIGLTTILNGNLSATLGNASNWRSALSTIYVQSGLLYAEMTVSSNANNFFGVALATSTFWNNGSPSIVGWTSDSWSYSSTGNKYTNATAVALGSAMAAGDIIGIALDLNNGAIYFSANGVFLGGAVPTSGASKTNAAYSLTTGLDYVFAFSGVSGTTGSVNFGQRPFAYTPPTGFVALNTYNLPDSTIKKGNKYMDATLYTGNGSTQTIVNNAQFKPDLVWAKGRSNAVDHGLFDSNRGNTKLLSSNLTAAELTYTNQVTSFNSNGFSLGADNLGYSNYNGVTYVGWQWQAGQGSTSSNTAGSITSTVSVNTTAGFSIVSYTGNATSGATIGHGLGVAPKMVIVKNRPNTYAWIVYHASTGNTGALFLEQTTAFTVNSVYWNNTSPSSSVITLGNTVSTNGSGAAHIAYCFAEIAGFSKFGSYTGNGSADGPFVFTNFRPKYVMIKGNAVVNWWILDTSRNTYNVANEGLLANSSAATNATINPVDFVSNGFKLRDSNGEINANGTTYVYACFAESPFKNSLAR